MDLTALNDSCPKIQPAVKTSNLSDELIQLGSPK